MTHRNRCENGLNYFTKSDCKLHFLHLYFKYDNKVCKIIENNRKEFFNEKYFNTFKTQPLSSDKCSQNQKKYFSDKLTSVKVNYFKK